MKHILHLACIVPPIVCGTETAMALTPGLPPASGPGSLFYGQPEMGGDPAGPTQKFQRKQKKIAPIGFPLAPRSPETVDGIFWLHEVCE